MLISFCTNHFILFQVLYVIINNIALHDDPISTVITSLPYADISLYTIRKQPESRFPWIWPRAANMYLAGMKR